MSREGRIFYFYFCDHQKLYYICSEQKMFLLTNLNDSPLEVWFPIDGTLSLY
jgi:hypothetical protein